MSGAPQERLNWRNVILVSVAVAALYAVMYALLAARDLVFGDGGELTLAAAIDGVAHPPGYPLWIAIAHAFTLLPLGTIPFRAALFAVLCHAFTLGIVCVTGTLLTRNVLAGVFAAAVLACAPLFVTWSLQPEVFSLNDLLAASILLCTVLLVTRPGRWWLFVVSGGLLGLGLANHQTLVLVAPLLLWAFFCKRDELPARRELVALGAFAALALVLGFLLPYLHTLAASQRELAWPFQTAQTFPQFVSLISREYFGGAGNLVAGSMAGGTFGSRFGTTLVALWPILPVVVLGALLSNGAPNRLSIPAFWGFFVAVLFALVSNINLDGPLANAVFTRFTLLPLTLLAPYAAVAIPAVQRIFRKRHITATVVTSTIVAGALVMSVVYAQTHALADRHDARTLVTNVFATLPHGAVLLVWGEFYDDSIPYFQAVEGLRPDVTSVLLPLLQLNGCPGCTALVKREGIALGAAQTTRSNVVMRDAIADANPTREIYVAGAGPIAQTTASYTAYQLGLTTLLRKHALSGEMASLYRANAPILRAPDYGAVSIDPALTAGWGPALADVYGAAFFSMGTYTASLGKKSEARAWLTRANEYLPGDPAIQAALTRNGL